MLLQTPTGSVVSAHDIKTGNEVWSTTVDDLTEVDLRLITSQGEVLIFGILHPLQFSARDHNKKNPLVQSKTLELKTGAQLWASEALQPSLNLIRMITEMDGTFYLVGSYRTDDGLKVDPRVKRFCVASVNIGCQLAASTPNYILFKDHGGTP